MTRRLAAALGCLAVVACAGPDPRESLHEVSAGHYVMGTVLEATLFAHDPGQARRHIESAVELARELEPVLSRHDPESELSHVNRAAGKGAIDVTPTLAGVLARAHRANDTTLGAFDATVGPLVALWVEAAERDRIPAAGEISEALGRVGRSRFEVTAGQVRLAAGSRLDLGGIAKGIALDRMAVHLREENVSTALLSFGQSSTWALGAPPGTSGWRLLVRGAGETDAGTITLRNQALSVSGSLGQASRIEGRVFGHVVDPRTGWPLEQQRQALVLAPDATEAEVLSTALLVLGPGEGIALLEARPGCEGLLLDTAGGRWETSGFRSTARFEPRAAPGSAP